MRFLLAYSPHQTIPNYIIATDYLCRNKDVASCLAFLEQGLVKFPHAPELLSQQTFINKCFGIKREVRLAAAEDIFYSDS